jgi:DNA repair photolyase
MKIYEPTGRAREYSPLALNYLTGCTHRCKYCYVPAMNKRFNKNYDHNEFISNVNYEEIEKSIVKIKSNVRLADKQILLSFTTDPYQPGENGETRNVIKLLTKYNMHFTILTKNPKKFYDRDIDLLKRYPHFSIGTTLTLVNTEQSLLMEPGAPVSTDRMIAIRNIADEHIKTWVSFEPVLNPNNTLQFLYAISNFINYVKIGKINNCPDLEKSIDWYDFLIKAVSICRDIGLPFYIKKDLQAYNEDIILTEKEIDMDYLNV